MDKTPRLELWVVDPDGDQGVLLTLLSRQEHIVRAAYDRWGRDRWGAEHPLGARQAWLVRIDGETAQPCAVTADPSELQLIVDAVEDQARVDPPAAISLQPGPSQTIHVRQHQGPYPGPGPDPRQRRLQMTATAPWSGPIRSTGEGLDDVDIFVRPEPYGDWSWRIELDGQVIAEVIDDARDEDEALERAEAWLVDHDAQCDADDAVPRARDVSADLAVINDHRRQLGMAPLDPVAAGWTDDDVHLEAEVLRATNPRAHLLAWVTSPMR